ncbi:Uncharacterized protein At4g02000, partial [Linum perenne]
QLWIPVGVSDIVTSCSNGIKSISLSQGFKEKLCKPWSFSIEQDYFKALTGGPWILLDHHLAIHQWDPSFRVSNELPKKLVAWVRFPHLPIHFYHVQVLTSLGNLIGKTIIIDFNTQTTERGKFARIAVEIDLDKPLPPVVLLDGAIQQVEYENLPNLCFECGRVGHDKVNCPERVVLITSDQQLVETPPIGVAADPLPIPTTESYGPWMVVSRRSKKEVLSKKESNHSRFGKEVIKEDGSLKSSEGKQGDNYNNFKERETSPLIKEIGAD